jgi:hypothetical protein
LDTAAKAQTPPSFPRHSFLLWDHARARRRGDRHRFSFSAPGWPPTLMA